MRRGARSSAGSREGEERPGADPEREESPEKWGVPALPAQTSEASRSLGARPVAPLSVAARLDDRRPHELPFFKALGQETQARPVPGQNLHVVAALAAEHEGRARKRIVAQNLRHIGGESVKAASYVDGLQRQIDLYPGRDLKHQRSPSADNTRRRASVPTSVSSDRRAPFSGLTSVAPRRAFFCTARTGFVEAIRGADAAFNSTTSTGTEARVAFFRATVTATVFDRVRRRSGQPSHARRIHLKTRFAFRPCLRTTDATDAPRADASATIHVAVLRGSTCAVRHYPSPPTFWRPPVRWWTPVRRSSDHAYVVNMDRKKATLVVMRTEQRQSLMANLRRDGDRPQHAASPASGVHPLPQRHRGRGSRRQGGVHVILDNYAAHKHPKVRAWLARHPRRTLTQTIPLDR